MIWPPIARIVLPFWAGVYCATERPPFWMQALVAVLMTVCVLWQLADLRARPRTRRSRRAT